MSMLITKLHAIKVIDEDSPQKVVNSLCCSNKTVQCLFKDCEKCKDKIILYNDFSANDSTSFNKWIDKKVQVVVKGVIKEVKKSNQEIIQLHY